MFKATPIGSSAPEVQYYTRLGRDAYEYYSDEIRPGTWFGEGAKRLGLVGDVEEEIFGNLLQGKSLDGTETWVHAPKDPKKKRRCGWDLTAQLSKSVSAFWALSPEKLRPEVLEVCEEALENILGEFTKSCAVTRRGHNGLVQEEAGLIGAIFQHDTSRPADASDQVPDPHLHWHVVIVNAVVSPDGSVRAWDVRPLFRKNMVMSLGALFRLEVARGLRERLGLEAYRPEKENRRGEKVGWFELKCIPKALVQALSKRGKKIEEWVKKHGVSGWRAKGKAARATREQKREFSPDELDISWLKEAELHGVTQETLLDALNRAPEITDPERAARVCLNKAVHRIAKTESRFTMLDVLRFTAEEAQDTGLGMVDVLEVVENALSQSPELVRLKDVDGEKQWTTGDNLRVEERMLKTGERLSQTRTHTVKYSAITHAMEKFPTLEIEQKEAIRYLVGSGDLACLNGVAGAGKTFLLNVVREIFESEGYRVLGTSLQKKATRELREGSGIESIHLHRLFRELESGAVQLDSNTVLVCDEAGMVGTRMMERVTSLIEESGAKLVLSGGVKQLQAIEAGAPFRVLAEENTVCEVNKILRQRDAWHRETVHDLRAGRSGQALVELAKRDLLYIGEDHHDAMAQAIIDWRRRAIDEGELKGSLVIAGTNQDVITLNKLAQGERLLAGELSEELVRVGEYEFHVGDRVMATRNQNSMLLDNGMVGTVTELNGNVIRTRFDDGLHLAIDTRVYDHLALSYASTVHRAQGLTSEYCFLVTDEVMTDLHQAYVAGSRPRGEVRFYSDVLSSETIKELARIMERDRSKDLAHEWLPEQTMEIS